MSTLIKVLVLVALAQILIKLALIFLAVMFIVWALNGFRGHIWHG
jgi:hypothetical protein